MRDYFRDSVRWHFFRHCRHFATLSGGLGIAAAFVVVSLVIFIACPVTA
jgi:hypothetical protein